MMVIFIVAADGSVTVARRELRWAAPSRVSRLAEIREKLADTNAPADEILRLIHEELVLVIQQMGECAEHGHDKSAVARLKSCAGQVTALRALQKLVVTAEAHSNRDVLNFDGPKFAFVFDRLLDLFRQAVDEALGKGQDSLSQSIMKSFRDLIAANEHDIRRDTEKIGAGGLQPQ
jgi:hypothetical protein